MKSQIPLTCAVLFFSFFNGFSQSTSLTVLPSGVYTTKEKSIAESTKDSDNHKTLMAVVRAADLEETLDVSGPFTVFAPSDNAFSRLPKDKLNSLLYSNDKTKLKSLLKYHIVAGELSASKILKAMCRGGGMTTFTSIEGAKITATICGTDIILMDSLGNSATITLADSKQSNGVIHEIDSVILPGRI